MGSSYTRASTAHADQSLPFEWRAVGHGGETLVVHDAPERLPDCYRVVGATLEAWVLAFADAVLYDGTVVEPAYTEATRRIRLQHAYGGTKVRLNVADRLEEPVVLLERCQSVDLERDLQTVLAEMGETDV